MTAAAREERLRDLVEGARGREAFSAASLVVLRGGEPLARFATGTLARVDGQGIELPEASLEATAPDTLFDLASLTKVFSAHTLLALVRDGALELDAPLAEHLDSYRTGERAAVTLRHLLTHTSGLPAEWTRWRRHPGAARDVLLSEGPDALLNLPLEAPAGSRWTYSCAGFNTAMVLAERATGERWPDLVARLTLIPLDIPDATFAPDPARTAATEIQHDPDRGLIRGVVHDETSWALGGGAANAGLFGTAASVAAMGEGLRTGRDEPVGQLWDPALGAVLGRETADPVHAPYGASLGMRIGETSWMGGRGGASRGHTGFTGTSLQVDRATGLVIVLLTNRVHPTRENDGVHPLRAAIADAAFEAAA